MSSVARRSRGFTIIELMIAVAILGMLSTIAYPFVNNATLRSKSTERRFVMKAVHDAVEDAYRVAGRFPPDPASVSVFSSYNPPLPLSTAKRDFQPGLGSWPLITQNLRIEGGLYYSYFFMAFENGAPFLWVYALGDLDGDGIASAKSIQYNRTNGAYSTSSVYPPDGAEDDQTYGTF